MVDSSPARNLIDGSTKLTGVIGWPVEHSLSPAMHNAAFRRLGINWVYLPLPVYPDHLGEAVRGLRAMSFAGANVTVPHKQAVMPYLDDISYNAQVIGAVNTIVVRDGSLYGDNTDAPGFLACLAEVGFQVGPIQVAVLGAGGAARAVVHALAQAGASGITVFNRSLARARQLCQDMARFHPDGSIQADRLQRVDQIDERFHLLVNTTSVGMWPDVEVSPWPSGLEFPPHLTVCDLVYNPAETRLLAQARAAGAETVNGLGMLVHQGAIAFELWTGKEAPTSAMRTACLQALGRSA